MSSLFCLSLVGGTTPSICKEYATALVRRQVFFEILYFFVIQVTVYYMSPKTRPKHKTVSIPITIEQHARFAAMSVNHDTTLAHEIRVALTVALHLYDKEKK